MLKTAVGNIFSLIFIRIHILCAFVIIFLPQLLISKNVSNDDIKAHQFIEQRKQLGFQENKGQLKNNDGTPAKNVLFKTDAPGLTIWITTSGITYQFLKEEEQEGKKEEVLISEWKRVDMQLKDATILKENSITEGEITEGEINYFLAHCKDGVFGVKTYSKVTIKNVYEGIDWVLYTNNNLNGESLKQDFIVHPGANPAQIKLLYEGNGKLDVMNNQIHFENAFGEIQEGKLFCYQESENKEINSKYIVSENLHIGNQVSNVQHMSSSIFSYEIGIQLSNYDKTKELIMDPQLVWATFYGGNDHDGTLAIETDATGDIFISGYTFSRNFPVLHPGGNTYQGVDSADVDAAFFKFKNNGVLVWATYYGGNKPDRSYSMCLDASGNFFVTGFAESTDFPTLSLAGAYNQPSNGGDEDAFIIKFSNSGQRLWASYYGGALAENGNSICCDISGNIYLTGYTSSASFPTFNPGGTTYYDGSISGDDAFILKFSNNGQRLWATYYGGVLDEYGNAICTDSNGNVFVTGSSESATFPTLNLPGAYNQSSNGGGFDAFLLKFNSSGERIWSSYYGGSLEDVGYSIFCDKTNNILVAGKTKSTASFPLLNPSNGAYYQASNGGGSDAFILKFNSSGQRLWATFYGGSGDETFDSFDNIAADNCGNVYFAFNTLSANMPLHSSSCNADYQKTTFGGNAKNDIFIAKFTNKGIRTWTTYWGGDGNDFRSGVAVDKFNNFLITGEWSEVVSNTTYPTLDLTGGVYFDATHNTNDDIYIARFKPSVPAFVQSQVNTVGCNNNCNGSATITIQCSEPEYSFVWSNGSQTLNTTNATNTVSNLCVGTYTVNATLPCVSEGLSAIFNITNSTSNPLPNISVGNTLNLGCTLTSGTITASSTTPGVSYSWQGPGIVSGSSSSSPTVNAAGTYTVTVTDPVTNCTNSSTVVVSSNTSTPPITTGNPLVLTCTTLSGTISVSTSVTGASYSWQGPGIVSGNTTSAPTVNTTGTYTVTVTNPSNGCTNTATVQVNSNTLIPDVAVGNTLQLNCSAPTGTINASSTTSSVNYSWQGPGIVSGSNTSSPIVNAAGTYTVTVTNTVSGCTNTATVQVNMNGVLPNVTNGNPITLSCSVTTGIISASSTTAGVLYSWQGPGIVSGGTTSSPTVNAGGTYTVTVTDTSSGCTNTATITVAGGSTLPNVAVGNTLAFNCITTSGTISVSSTTSGVTYAWQGPGIISGGNSTSIVVNVPGTYTVIVTDPVSGCTNTTTIAVNSNTTPPNATTNATALLTCLISSTSINVNSTTPNVSYNWSGPGIVSGGTTASPIINLPGMYTVTVTDPFTGCTNTAMVMVNQAIMPTANVSPDITIVEGSATTVVATGGGNYNWFPSTGLSCSNCANPTATPEFSTTYCVAVTDTNGCADTACIRIEVLDLCPSNADSTIIPNVFSPNGDNKNDLFYIEGWNDVCVENIGIQIYNRWGQIIFVSDAYTKLWDGRTPSGIESPEGTYFYIITIKRKKTEAKIYKGSITLIR